MKACPGYLRELMSEALAEARLAAAEGEIPVGAVVVRDGKVIGRGRNTREGQGDITGHAELNAIREAERFLGDWRLAGCDLYVTMEPCPMCMGAILASRVDRLIYGCPDPVAGACRTVTNVFASGLDTGKLQVFDGIMADECSGIIGEFFNGIR